MLIIIKVDLGRRIKVARAYMGLSQGELAEKINKTRPLISHIESTGKVNSYTLQKICKVLNLEAEDLLNENDELYVSKKDIRLKKDLLQMQEKVEILEELVRSQREIISNLKVQLERRRKN